MQLGEPLVFLIISRIVLGAIPQGFDVYINSIAFAGWIGIFVTAFNLLPIGQLDGGHIAYSILGKKHIIVAKIAFFALIPLAFLWIGWLLIIAILGLIIKLNHPPPVDDSTPLDFKRKLIGITCLIILVLSFTFVPYSILNG